MYQNNSNPYANNFGYAYGVPRPQARNTQPLTPEQISKLRQDSKAFDMKVEVEDLWRAACTHKEKNGQSTLIANEDGSYTCTICHETFKMCDSDRKEIEAAVNTLVDMLQTSKTVYLDAPEELIRQYFQMIPLLKKFPDLWDRAMKNFSMYEGTAFTGVNQMGPGFSGFAALQNLMTNPYAGYGYNAYAQAAPQQPMQGYGYQIWVEKNNGFAFRGMGGQFMFAYPEKDLVIACHSDGQFDPTGTANKRLAWAIAALAESVTQDELPRDDAAAAHLQARLENLTPKALAGDMDSPLREKINGAVYDITAKNHMGWQQVRFEFREKEGTVYYKTDRGDKAISFGFGFRKEGFFPENHYWGRRINEPKNAPYACEASAAWVQEDKLAIRIYITDEHLAGMQMEFAFKGDQIALRMNKVAEFFLSEYEGFAGGKRREETV